MTIKSSEIRKIQGLDSETSFSVVLPKKFATKLGIGKGDFVRLHQDGSRIVVEKA